MQDMYATNSTYAHPLEGQEVRTSEVQTELGRLLEVSDYLEKCLSDLESKLNPILAQHKVEQDAQNKSAPEPLRVPLAETLHIRVSHLTSLRERVSSMITRLEL